MRNRNIEARCLVLVMLFLLLVPDGRTANVKRNAASDETISFDYPEYQIGVKYDEYPVS